MWGEVVYPKGRNHSEKWGYFVLSSVLSLQSGSKCGLFPPVPTAGPAAPQHPMPVLENLPGSQQMVQRQRNLMPGQFGWCKHPLKHVNLCKQKKKKHKFHTVFIKLMILFSRGIYSCFTRGVKLASKPTTRLRVSLTYTHECLHMYTSIYIYIYICVCKCCCNL